MMKVINAVRALGISLAIVTLAGCSGKLDREAYVKWIRDYDHELHVKEEHDEFVFDLQYTPADYVWLQRNATTTDHATYEAEKKDIEQTQYYTLTISVKDDATDFIDYGISDIQEKQRKLYYFSYLFQDDIKLEENGEQLPCVLFHFEKPVDLKRSRTFMLGFENIHPDAKEARLVISSPQFGSLPFKIKISKDHIPTLDIQ